MPPASRAQTTTGVPEVTRTVAIEGARIVQAPGRVIERGTVVMRDGLILAVGTDVQIPYDAERIDGDSLTVYAGFIDGLSHAGIPQPKASSDRESVRDPGNPPPDRAGIQPDRDARALLVPDDASVDALRQAGFTVAHTVPHGGMLPGTGAIVLLAGDDADAMVLRPEASLFARFEGARGVYPATPMGVMATWRQLYREAERRRQVETLYAANPAGLERPPYDPVHAALAPVVAGTRPVFFYTDGDDGALDVYHALALQQDLGFSLVLAGLNQGFQVVDALKAADAPLLLTLGLPEDPDEKKDTRQDTSRAAIDTVKTITPPPPSSFFDSDLRTFTYEDVEAEHENLEARRALVREQYANVADTLYRAGLRFGVSTLDVKPDVIQANLRKMVAAGLPEEAALAALTVEGARVLGIEAIAGTIEPGKLANLVVTKGSYFDEEGRIHHVFVEGRRFTYEKEQKAGAETSVAGTWDYSVSTPDGRYTGTLTLSGTGRRLSGTLRSQALAQPADLENVSFDGETLTFTVSTAEFGRVSARLTFEGETFSGTVDVPDAGALPIEGTRTGRPD